MLGFVLVHPHETPCIDHLGGKQTRTAELANDFPEGGIGKARHRRLQNRRVNDQIANQKRGKGVRHQESGARI